MSRTVTPGACASVSRIAAPPAPGSIPTMAGLLVVPGNATAIVTDIRMGKMNAQKIASGSRANSRSRARDSSISG